jgi:hypothetical protein
MRNPVVEFRLIRIGFGVRLCDALGDHFAIALFMARVLAVRALHSSRVLQEISAQSAPHNVIELLLDKLMPVLFMDFLSPLSNGTFPVQTDVEGSSVFALFD